MRRQPIPGHRPRGRALRGFSLLEVLVAMAVLGICLVFMTQLLVQETFIERRTASQTAALHLLEAHAELLRAGLALPDDDGRYSMDLLVELPADAAVEDPKLVFDLARLEPKGLWRLDLQLSYRVAGRPRTLEMEMRLWRP